MTADQRRAGLADLTRLDEEMRAPAEGDAARRGLLPCPFCGRRPVLTVRPDNADATSYFAAVACFCDGYAACAHKDATASEADEAERLAREKWNGRAAHPQPKGTAKCNCTAYCGQYLMHGSCPAYPAAVTVVPAPAPLTSVCHMECGGCIDAGKCAFPGKPAEPARYPHPDEDDAVTLWAEIHRLRAAVQGPDGYATWQEAATAERVRRVAAEKALTATQSPAPAHGTAPIVEDAATVLERRDEFGHSHKGDAAALREWAGSAPLQRLHDLITDGNAPDWGNLPQTDLASRWYVTLCEAIEREFNATSASPAVGDGQ